MRLSVEPTGYLRHRIRITVHGSVESCIVVLTPVTSVVYQTNVIRDYCQTLPPSSTLHRRGHNVPLINCPSCEHHICDVSNTIQCEVCQIKVEHHGQPPIDTKCFHIGHCHSDDHHHCCDTEACVASFFRELHITNTTTHQITYTDTDSMAHCPTCHGGDCDFVNRDTCHVCKFDLHPGHLPHVHCLNGNEHCTGNHNTLCCSDESCIAHAFGSFYPDASSRHPTTSKEIHVTDPNVHCPHCHGGFCDFVNRDTCHVCKFVLHTGKLPHVDCLKGNSTNIVNKSILQNKSSLTMAMLTLTATLRAKVADRRRPRFVLACSEIEEECKPRM
ncbi:uncharacterized protein LOC134230929 [Saccostrea cucullata]|uniref:uncharacterized protein LOC134230929 n=1 Tax=Saccostrea cuccullata TaxID=36930 RepID=UPI002ED109A7